MKPLLNLVRSVFKKYFETTKRSTRNAARPAIAYSSTHSDPSASYLDIEESVRVDEEIEDFQIVTHRQPYLRTYPNRVVNLGLLDILPSNQRTRGDYDVLEETHFSHALQVRPEVQYGSKINQGIQSAFGYFTNPIASIQNKETSVVKSEYVGSEEFSSSGQEVLNQNDIREKFQETIGMISFYQPQPRL